MQRVDKQNYYLDIAQTVAERSTCLRRRYGAIIVSNDEIVSTGFNGAPRGRKNCIDLGYCTRESLNIPRGERYELCRSVHAEANCIISAARREMLGSTLYLVGIDGKTGALLGLSLIHICASSRSSALPKVKSRSSFFRGAGRSSSSSPSRVTSTTQPPSSCG